MNTERRGIDYIGIVAVEIERSLPAIEIERLPHAGIRVNEHLEILHLDGPGRRIGGLVQHLRPVGFHQHGTRHEETVGQLGFVAVSDQIVFTLPFEFRMRAEKGFPDLDRGVALFDHDLLQVCGQDILALLIRFGQQHRQAQGRIGRPHGEFILIRRQLIDVHSGLNGKHLLPGIVFLDTARECESRQRDCCNKFIHTVCLVNLFI